MLKRSYRITMDAIWRFAEDDGWAIASHIALSVLMSLFPFLIFVTAMAGYFGTEDLAKEVVKIILEAWPEQVAQPLAGEITTVLTSFRRDVLTLGVVLAIYFSSSGIESLRIGLNRAYAVREMRYWYWCRVESILYVILGAFALLALAFLVVLFPLGWATALRHFEWLAPFGWIATFLRFAVASLVIVIALILVHLYLPAGRRTLSQIAPGVIVTLLLWLISGAIFGRYLAEFAWNYVSTYAGLASVMIALVFLYWTATIFVFGGELNAAIEREKLTPPKHPQGTSNPSAGR